MHINCHDSGLHQGAPSVNALLSIMSCDCKYLWG